MVEMRRLISQALADIQSIVGKDTEGFAGTLFPQAIKESVLLDKMKCLFCRLVVIGYCVIVT